MKTFLLVFFAVLFFGCEDGCEQPDADAYGGETAFEYNTDPGDETPIADCLQRCSDEQYYGPDCNDPSSGPFCWREMAVAINDCRSSCGGGSCTYRVTADLLLGGLPYEYYCSYIEHECEWVDTITAHVADMYCAEIWQ